MRCSLFNEDPETEAIIMIGEIGGTAEETAAEYVKQHVNKPVWLHRRTNRASRTPHGTRRRHHLRR